jgi:hypothetical protein
MVMMGVEVNRGNGCDMSIVEGEMKEDDEGTRGLKILDGSSEQFCTQANRKRKIQ